MLSCCYQRLLPQRPPAVWNRRNTCRPSSAPSPSTSNPTAATRSPTVPSSACPQVLQRYQVHPPLNAWFFLCRLVFAPLCVLRGSYLLLVSSWLHKMLFMFWADLQRNWSTIVWLYKESRTWRGHLPSISLLALTALHSRIADAQTTQILPRQLCSVTTINFSFIPTCWVKGSLLSPVNGSS